MFIKIFAFEADNLGSILQEVPSDQRLQCRLAMGQQHRGAGPHHGGTSLLRLTLSWISQTKSSFIVPLRPASCSTREGGIPSALLTVKILLSFWRQSHVFFFCFFYKNVTTHVYDSLVTVMTLRSQSIHLMYGYAGKVIKGHRWPLCKKNKTARVLSSNDTKIFKQRPRLRASSVSIESWSSRAKLSNDRTTVRTRFLKTLWDSILYFWRAFIPTASAGWFPRSR